MKRAATLMAAIICSFILTTSCNDCNVDIDPAPNPVCIIVKDADGNNLLDAEFADNILDNDIIVTYNGEEYPLILSEYDDSGFMGLHTGEIGEDKIPGILFWYFYVGRDSGGGEFTISWGDGTTDAIKFDFYYTVVNCKVKGHRKIYLNGKLQSNNSLVVTVVK